MNAQSAARRAKYRMYFVILPGAPFDNLQFFMVGVAQLVECKIVILVVVGSIPIVHPIFENDWLSGRQSSFLTET